MKTSQLRIIFGFCLLLVTLSGIVGCSSTKTLMTAKPIMEVTTFNINVDVAPQAFSKLDAQVESNFTSRQSGFIKRQSGIDDTGNYVVVVYWESMADADASMSKFMDDASVGNYAKMIDPSSMKMSRYEMDKAFDAKDSRFVEIMSFDVKANTNMADFNATNQKVETEFTGKQKGFLQRLTGVNEAGNQVIVVYWTDEELSNASLQPFMEAPIAKQLMSSMDQSSISMGRYKFLPEK